jgi:hypothetical protein
MVDQIADLFRTTPRVKTQEVVKIRGQDCGDVEMTGYLANTAGPVSLVLDLRISHDRVGSRTDPTLKGHLKYPNNLDQSHNNTETAASRINLNIDGAPITSKTHTHPSHSQTSRILTSSLSLGVPVPRSTQCM